MQKKNIRSNKINKKGAFGVLFSLFIGMIALPIWVFALTSNRPHIDIFSADAESGFRTGASVEFKMKGGDLQDANLDAFLDYGDGQNYNFQLLGGASYVQKHAYANTGDYAAKLTLRDSASNQKSVKLNFTIYDKLIPQIKNFSFNEESYYTTNDRVYVNYEIDCLSGKADLFSAYLVWGDGTTDALEIACGPAVISHQYQTAETYDLGLKVKDLSSNLVASKTLTATVTGEDIVIGSHAPRASFFIKTAWPKVAEPVYFAENATDPDGRSDIQTWWWNFGDGMTVDELNPTHTFRQAGRFKVSLTVTDRNNQKDTFYLWLDVTEEEHEGLVRAYGTQNIYQLIGDQRHWIPNPVIFLDYGFHESDVKVISQSELNTYSRAKLVRVNGSSDIYYLTESWLKRRIPNMEIFESYGNQSDDVITISQKELNAYEENRLIKFDGNYQIYYLENGVKHWIKSAAVFNRRGFDWKKIAPINSVEFNAYVTGSVME